MSKLLYNFTLIVIAILVLNSCDRVSTPISPVESDAETPVEIVDESKIILTWEDKADSEVGFEIFERSGSEGEFIPLMRTEANVTTVMLDKHRRAFDFYYKVRVMNGDGASGFSNVARVVGIHRAITAVVNRSWSEIAISPDGSQITAAGQYIKHYDYYSFAIIGGLVIADAINGEIIHLLDSPNQSYGSFGSCLSYSPDGRVIAVGTEQGEIESGTHKRGDISTPIGGCNMLAIRRAWV